jgi:FkbM family methyltransferase
LFVTLGAPIMIRTLPWRVVRRVVETIDRLWIRLATRCVVNQRSGAVRLGSDYGGWWIPERLLDGPGVAYCAGAGEDITFDMALLDLGFVVRTLDPTPRAVAHIRSLEITSDSFSFLPVALWSEDTTLTLYAPSDPTHVSHSALNLQHTAESLDVVAISLPTAMRRCGDEWIDLLKMDIEGAEVAVIPSIGELAHPPMALCIEFDAARPYRRLLNLAATLRAQGYRTVRCDGRNVLFDRTPDTGDEHYRKTVAP